MTVQESPLSTTSDERSETARPRVLHASKLYHPWQGGIEAVIKWHAEGLSDRYQTSVLACVPRGRARSDVINGVSVRRAMSFGMFLGMPVSPSYLLEFRRLAQQSEITHLHLPFPPADISQVLFGNKNARLVVTWHSDLVRQRAIMPFYRPFMRRLLDRADRIIVPARTVLENSRHLAPYRDKCRVVPLGIPIPEKEPLDAPIAGVPDDEQVVLTVGRLAYYKGTQHLIAAMQGIDARLVIVGSGERDAELRRLAESSASSDRIHFTGHVSAEELDAWYRRCDVFVLPSDGNAETTGIVQLEAMARRKPVVNTQLDTDVPEVSPDGVTGLTVEPGSPDALAEAINRLLSNDGLRIWFGENGRVRVRQQYSVEQMNATVGDIYDELLGIDTRRSSQKWREASTSGLAMAA